MIDLNTLLDPIDPTNRGGVSLLYEGVHQEIMEARREDDASLPRGDWSRPLKVADWQDVTNIGTNTLLKKSKYVLDSTNVFHLFKIQASCRSNSKPLR